MEKTTKQLKTKIQDVNENGTVVIQITQFDKYDSDNDRLLSGSLTKTWKENKQYHLVDHRFGISTFVGLPIKKDPLTGVIESKLNLKKQIALDLLEDYKFTYENGISLEHSHGFLGVKGKYEKNEKGGYDFREVMQFEYSTVLFGAVSDTPLHEIKDKRTIENLIENLKLRLSVMNYSNEYGKLLELKVIELQNILKEPIYTTLENTKTEAERSLQENKQKFFNKLI